ncbi:hypothetical protein AAFF_G00317390 [Aldrovandia affinis]|uniref:Uncharacterized protein n=1 Tax=Aldrovandia affinis TaxID=143900 RepID=A0AAD7R764_9TELE|nr:hypothetical protein AAFF_G00317390 [Aldrovandia affinis]
MMLCGAFGHARVLSSLWGAPGPEQRPLLLPLQNSCRFVKEPQRRPTVSAIAGCLCTGPRSSQPRSPRNISEYLLRFTGTRLFFNALGHPARSRLLGAYIRGCPPPGLTQGSARR